MLHYLQVMERTTGDAASMLMLSCTCFTKADKISENPTQINHKRSKVISKTQKTF